MERYQRNKKLISQEEQERLAQARVTVLGCGGLGGYIIEMLSRIGVGKLTLVDYDIFDSSNLNRQLLSTEENLGSSKAAEAGRRVRLINSTVEVEVVEERLSPENIEEIIEGSMVVVDALDSIALKKQVEKACTRVNIPMVHGAIGGWIAQVAVVRPGDFLLEKLYGEVQEGVEKEMGNPSFTPALAASIQVGEVIKLLLNKGSSLEGEILYIDLENNSFSTLKLL